MDKKFDFCDLPFSDLPNEQDTCLISDDSCLIDSDFYPPYDDRVWQSNVEDINGGDNFADYCEYIYKILDEEDYFEN